MHLLSGLQLTCIILTYSKMFKSTTLVNSLSSPLWTHLHKLIIATFHTQSDLKLLISLVSNVAAKDSSFYSCTKLSSTVHFYPHYKSLTTLEPKYTSPQNYLILYLHYGSERLVILVYFASAQSSTTLSQKTSENYIYNIPNLNCNLTYIYPRFPIFPVTLIIHLFNNTTK